MGGVDLKDPRSREVMPGIIDQIMGMWPLRRDHVGEIIKRAQRTRDSDGFWEIYNEARKSGGVSGCKIACELLKNERLPGAILKVMIGEAGEIGLKRENLQRIWREGREGKYRLAKWRRAEPVGEAVAYGFLFLEVIIASGEAWLGEEDWSWVRKEAMELGPMHLWYGWMILDENGEDQWAQWHLGAIVSRIKMEAGEDVWPIRFFGPNMPWAIKRLAVLRLKKLVIEVSRKGDCYDKLHGCLEEAKERHDRAVEDEVWSLLLRTDPVRALTEWLVMDIGSRPRLEKGQLGRMLMSGDREERVRIISLVARVKQQQKAEVA